MKRRKRKKSSSTLGRRLASADGQSAKSCATQGMNILTRAYQSIINGIFGGSRKDREREREEDSVPRLGGRCLSSAKMAGRQMTQGNLETRLDSRPSISRLFCYFLLTFVWTFGLSVCFNTPYTYGYFQICESLYRGLILGPVHYTMLV